MVTCVRCCDKCFLAHYLREYISSTPQEDAICNFCGSSGPTLSPESLEPCFGFVDEFYLESLKNHPDLQPKPLVDLLEEDWGPIFNNSLLPREKTCELLENILGKHAGWASSPHVRHESARGITTVRWGDLREEMTHGNRWFRSVPTGYPEGIPEPLVDLNQLKNFYEIPELFKEKGGVIQGEWFRARLCRQGDDFGPKDMGAPPADKATHGRVNPAGIPYLYLASTANTAVSEVRPHVGAEVCLARYSVRDGLRVLDLATPIKADPFTLAYEQIPSILAGLDMLKCLAEELSRPVSPDSAAYDYSLTQYLCEFAKAMGFKGVSYRSAVSEDGVNLALFDPQEARLLDTVIERVRVSSARINFESLSN